MKERASKKRRRSKKYVEDELEFRWKDAGIERNEITFHECLAHGDMIFHIGDAVELLSSTKQVSTEGDYKKSWIAEIETMWEATDGSKWMECRWYYAINDIAQSSRPPYRKRELFETDHVSNNPVESIVDIVNVVSPSEWESLSEEEKNRQFFCEFIYSVKTTYIHPIYDFSLEKKKERIRLYSLMSSKPVAKSRRRSPAPTSPVDQLENAKTHLQLSWVPSHIPCREEEHRQIETYLRNSIKQKGNGSPLYVSGMPGTGKTATVREVILGLQDELNFDYMELNGMKVTSAASVFSMMYHHLTRKYVMASRASDLLNDYFMKPKKRERVLVVLADELDYLFTKNQQVIYKLFDWPNEPNSQLIVIGISNTIDLPERIMSLRNISRLSMNRISFKPYSRQQIATIINDRLQECSVFTPEAIDLCSRKVSAVSGDVRRALAIARRGIEIALERGETKVTIGIISEAAKEHVESYKMSLLQHCSKYQVLLLISIVLHMNAIGVDFVLISDIYSRMSALASRYCNKELLYPELQEIAASLASVGIISIVPPSTKFDTLFKLNIQADDVCYALKDDEIAKKELSILGFLHFCF
ncbi:hypothetical protein WA171_001661 [Blastocystis sp. BT1]